MFPLYCEFKKHLEKEKRRLAPLQVVSRLEEYLTKEFVSVVLRRSKIPILPITNIGSSRRIDVILTDGDLNTLEADKNYKPTIRAFVEVKFLRNRHRFGKNSANDENMHVLKDLKKQLGDLNIDNYHKYPVELWARRKSIYGLVFFSFVQFSNDGNSTLAGRKSAKEITQASKRDFRNHNDDKKAPMLKPVYRENVQILDCNYDVQLWMGLWRLCETKTGPRRLLV